ncbi:hypothetical protein BZM26_31575 [Paraburkholderia strydomiana]|nr:hypothetical protein BZM26_31575 [Paraburkholderia strydomiana]
MVALAQTSSLDTPGFLQLSKALTAHASMHTAFGTRLIATLCASDTDFASRAGSLVRQAREGQTSQQLLVFCRQADRSDARSLKSAAAATGRCYRFPFSKTYLKKSKNLLKTF